MQRPIHPKRMWRRRELLERVPALLLGAAALPAGLFARQEPFHVLPEDSLERLRVDFNANRNRVRLLFVLAPT